MTDREIANDPWSFDDYQRRTMLYLFSHRETEVEADRRALVRAGLLDLLGGIADGSASGVRDAINTIWDQYRLQWEDETETKLVEPAPVFAHPRDFDVVTNQLALETT